MKLNWIEFENLETGLKLDRINFNDDVSLLVGMSGAGKSQILKAIRFSRDLITDKIEKLRSYSVKMGFTIDSIIYEWSYTIDKISIPPKISLKKDDYAFVYEKLIENNTVIFERTIDSTSLIGYDRVPQPQKDKSLIFQYSNDNHYIKIYIAAMRLYQISIEQTISDGFLFTSADLNDTYIKIKKLLEIDNTGNKISISYNELSVGMKLYIAKKHHIDKYSQITDSIKEIFPEIKGIDIMKDHDTDNYILTVSVYGKRIHQKDISNGMLKTIFFITEMYMAFGDSLILIDEFENGLGVNCIDILSEQLLSTRSDLQFIITSHHPKIINGISPKKWKIIERNKNVIKNFTSDEYGIGNSKHDAYFNLLNRWEFEGKI